MQTFLHILKNKPLDRITVKDICEQCEINRNTFYYYFKDIYDVLEAIFEDEVRLVMDEAKEGVTFHDAYARVAALRWYLYAEALIFCGDLYLTYGVSKLFWQVVWSKDFKHLLL